MAHGFTLEDAWELPVTGGPEDFERLISIFTSFDPASWQKSPTKLLWATRDRLGQVFGLGRISRSAQRETPTRLAGRLPADLRGSASGVQFPSLPFIPLYRTQEEFAAELSNATVHGLMHLAWLPQPDGTFRGEMAVYVRPHGRAGRAYMALIRPFRHWIVYPALGRQVQHAWETGGTRLQRSGPEQ